MDLSQLTAKVKQLFAGRGGTDGIKQDAEELKDIATGEGSATDKAEAAESAVQEPGAPGPDR
jgi:hypothetical protein